MQKYSAEQIEQYTEAYNNLRYSISRVSWSHFDERMLAMDIDRYISYGFPIDFVPAECTTRLLEQCQSKFSFSPDTTIKLIEVGADVNAVNANGENALIREAKNNSWENVLPVILERTKNVNTKDKNGHTALSYLCLQYIVWSIDARNKKKQSQKFWKQIHLLLDAGADPQADVSWQTKASYMQSSEWQTEINDLVKHMAIYMQQKKELGKEQGEAYNYAL